MKKLRVRHHSTNAYGDAGSSQLFCSFIFIDAECMKENQTVPSSMDSGLLKANNKPYQYPQIFEVGSVNMAFNANSFWKQLRVQTKNSRGRAHGPFNTTADSELPSETREGEPKPEMRILLLLKQCIHMESCVPHGSAVKESACKTGDAVDLSSIPGSGRSPGGENGKPFQYSCLKNPKDRGPWWMTVQRVTKSQTWLSDWICMHEIQRYHLADRISSLLILFDEGCQNPRVFSITSAFSNYGLLLQSDTEDGLRIKRQHPKQTLLKFFSYCFMKPINIS